MEKIKLLLILCLFGVLIKGAWAQTLNEGVIESVSTSAQTFSLNQGHLDNYQTGTVAQFFIQTGPINYPKVFLIAEAELVKVFPKKSYWYVKKTHIPKVLGRNQKIYFSTVDDVTRMRPIRVRQKTVVHSNRDYANTQDFINKNQKNVPERLIKKKDDHEVSLDLFEENEIAELLESSHVVISEYESFKDKSGTYVSDQSGEAVPQRYFIGNKMVDVGDVAKEEDRILLESMSKGLVKKVDEMKFGIKSYYRDSIKRDQEHIGTIKSTYAQHLDDKKRGENVDPKVKAKIKRDGELWSGDYDDVGLRRYFVETGLEREHRRREVILNELDGHEIVFQFSNSLVSHGNTTDPNYQGRGYNVSLSYDLHLSRISRDLKKWTLQFAFEAGVSEYDTGIFNARSEEYSYGGFLNYYLINNPLTLNTFSLLAGIGLKSGSAAISSPDLEKEYSYQLLTIPSMQLMTKYRFRSGDLTEDTVNVGMSINLGITYDMKNLSLIDSGAQNINSKISVNDLKYIAGMSVFFRDK